MAKALLEGGSPAGQLPLAPEPAIVHVRIPDFAVAVILRARPDLRRRAVVVGGDGQGHGLVLAASPEARVTGILPGMALRTAERLCPHALVVAEDSRALAAARTSVLEALGRFTPLLEQEDAPATRPRRGTRAMESACRRSHLGVFLDVRGCERLFGSAESMARLIEADLARLGYTALAGIATSPSLAAVASALAAPSAPVLVPTGNERTFLDQLPLEVLEDLDGALLERLRDLGVLRAGQLARLPVAALRRRFGDAGAQAFRQARGMDWRPLKAPRAPEMLEALRDLEEPIEDSGRLAGELSRLANRLASRLAAGGRSASLMTLELTIQRTGTQEAGVRLSRVLRLKQPVAGAPAILARATELLVQLEISAPVVVLRLQLAELGPAATQLPLPLVSVGLGETGPVADVAAWLCNHFGPHAAYRVRLVPEALLPEEQVVWESPGAGTLGPLVVQRPAPLLVVRAGADGYPQALRRGSGPWESVCTICAHWRIRTRWWAQTTHRYYYLVETSGGALLEIYHEQGDGQWRLANRRD